MTTSLTQALALPQGHSVLWAINQPTIPETQNLKPKTQNPTKVTLQLAIALVLSIRKAVVKSLRSWVKSQ